MNFINVKVYYAAGQKCTKICFNLVKFQANTKWIFLRHSICVSTDIMNINSVMNKRHKHNKNVTWPVTSSYMQCSVAIYDSQSFCNTEIGEVSVAQQR